MQIIGYIASLGSLVCWIITLVKMFQTDTVLKAVLGIICGLWAFIWGWMNLEKTDQKNVMLAWTACMVVSIIMSTMQVMQAS